jgi:hypothetical protein
MAGPLDGLGQKALMAGTGPRTATRVDASGLGDIVLQQTDVFIVDVADLLGAELADFATTSATTAAKASAAAATTTTTARTRAAIRSRPTRGAATISTTVTTAIGGATVCGAAVGRATIRRAAAGTFVLITQSGTILIYHHILPWFANARRRSRKIRSMDIYGPGGG